MKPFHKTCVSVSYSMITDQSGLWPDTRQRMSNQDLNAAAATNVNVPGSIQIQLEYSYSMPWHTSASCIPSRQEGLRHLWNTHHHCDPRNGPMTLMSTPTARQKCLGAMLCKSWLPICKSGVGFKTHDNSPRQLRSGFLLPRSFSSKIPNPHLLFSLFSSLLHLSH